MTDRGRRSDAHDERISLAPLDPEQALRALLKVDPESEPVEDQQAKDAGANDQD